VLNADDVSDSRQHRHLLHTEMGLHLVTHFHAQEVTQVHEQDVHVPSTVLCANLTLILCME